MKYIDICTKDDYVLRMEDVAHSRVAQIPIIYVFPGTEYWISENGDKVFVVREICGRMFIDSIKIHTKKRSANSGPYIKYRTNRKTQTALTVDRAVYGAFILKDTIPKHHPVHKDGNLLNCALVNLESTEKDGRLKKRLDEFADVYILNFSKLVTYCQVTFAKDYLDAQDIVSDAFITTCQRRTVIRNFIAVWVLSINKRQVYRIYDHTHASLEDI